MLFFPFAEFYREYAEETRDRLVHFVEGSEVCGCTHKGVYSLRIFVSFVDCYLFLLYSVKICGVCTSTHTHTYTNPHAQVIVSTHAIRDISCCSSDIEDKRVFAYITKDKPSGKNYSHVFMATTQVCLYSTVRSLTL